MKEARRREGQYEIGRGNQRNHKGGSGKGLLAQRGA